MVQFKAVCSSQIVVSQGGQTTDGGCALFNEKGADSYSPLFTHISIGTLFPSIINSPSRNADNIA